MRIVSPLYGLRILLLLFIVWCSSASSLLDQEQEQMPIDSVSSLTPEDSARISAVSDSILTAAIDASLHRERFIPDPIRAMWLGLVFPGGGQIYNHKYWKLPIFYGGVVGCVYAMTWNNNMYRDYSQAYMDLVDNNPSTQSYNQFLHLGNKITPENEARYEEIFRKRKDRYRRWRDLSVFSLIGVYALSIIDAYVDASLSDFDISKDLSMHIQPTIINNQLNSNPLNSGAIGLQCSLNF